MDPRLKECKTVRKAWAYVKKHGPTPALEHFFESHPDFALAYAENILKSPFLAAEPFIASKSGMAVRYTEEVLRGPFVQALNIQHDISSLRYMIQHALETQKPIQVPNTDLGVSYG